MIEQYPSWALVENSEFELLLHFVESPTSKMPGTPTGFIIPHPSEAIMFEDIVSRRSGDYITSALKRDQIWGVTEQPFRHFMYWLAKNSLIAVAARLSRARYVRVRWEAMNEVPPELRRFLAEHDVDDVDAINTALSGGAQMTDYHLFSGNGLISARRSVIDPHRKVSPSVEKYWWSFILPVADRLFGYK